MQGIRLAIYLQAAAAGAVDARALFVPLATLASQPAEALIHCRVNSRDYLRNAAGILMYVPGTPLARSTSRRR